MTFLRAPTVAIAYVMQKVPYVFPIIGGRKVEHLHANIEALNIALTPEHIKRIEGAVPFDLGFPTSFVVSLLSPVVPFVRAALADIRTRQGDGSQYGAWGFPAVAHVDQWPLPEAIRPKPSL